jgi:hypothetical protein
VDIALQIDNTIWTVEVDHFEVMRDGSLVLYRANLGCEPFPFRALASGQWMSVEEKGGKRGGAQT